MADELLAPLRRARARAGLRLLAARRLLRGVRGHLPLRGDPRPARRHRRRAGGHGSSQRPMDRLVCGDVGYGKTEVAMRAAFKAVHGRQAGRRARADHRPRASSTSRPSRSASPATRSRSRCSRASRAGRRSAPSCEGLADGTVDIVIGTHRLLQKDVQFQRPRPARRRRGAALRRRAQGAPQAAAARPVDVLTLTATPIPRTLQMALVGAARPLGHRDAAGRPAARSAPRSCRFSRRR